MNLKFDTLAPNQIDRLSRPDGGEYATLLAPSLAPK